MRLTQDQIELIRGVVRDILGDRARITLFGSRVDDRLHGGDVDLLIEVADPATAPAVLTARIASRISRRLEGRRVDVVLDAPNLIRQPIFKIARDTGVRL